MAPRPPDGATFEVSQIERARSRAPLGALLWSAALVGIVAVGAFGRSSERPVAEAVPAPTTIALGLATPRSVRPPALGTDLALVDAIDLQVPAPGPVTLMERQLRVFGKVLVRAARVEISLEAPNNRVIDHLDVDVSDPDGGIRPAQQPQFEAHFAVPDPRPSGTMWVVVTAYDADGMPLGGERRPFLVGPIGQSTVNVNWHNPQSR